VKVRSVAVESGAGQLRATLGVAPCVQGELLMNSRVPGAGPVVRHAGFGLVLLEGPLATRLVLRRVAEGGDVQSEQCCKER